MWTNISLYRVYMHDITTFVLVLFKTASKQDIPMVAIIYSHQRSY